jgi:hypothetical protein
VPGVAAAKKPPAVRGDAMGSSQRSILKRKALKARVTVRHTTYVRVFAGFRPAARNAPQKVITRVVEVKVRRGHPRGVKLALNKAGLKELRTCDAGRIVVSTTRIAKRAGAPMGGIVRTKVTLRRDAASCAKSGSGGGSGGGGSGGGGSGGGGTTKPPQQPVDYEPANADRCDWIDEADCLFPWPNDLFTTADSTTTTKRRVNLNILSMPRNVDNKPVDPAQFNRNDGFSPGQEIVTKVPGLETQKAFDKTGAVPIDDMAGAFRPSQPVVLIDTASRARHLIWAEIDSNPTDPANVTLIIRPGQNMLEGHRYVVALRNLRGEDGKVLPANLAFRIYRDAIPTSSDPVEARRAHFESIFQTLAEAGIERDDLYRAWDFTVASEKNISERMLAIRDDAFKQLGDTNLKDMKVQGSSPAFKVTRVDNYTVAQNSRLLKAIYGTVTVPCYLDAPGCPSGSSFLFDPSKTNGPPFGPAGVQPIPGNTYDARFTCIVPRSAATAPARVSLYGHGLLGSRDEAFQGQLQNFANEHNIIFCGVDWIGMACADLPDVPGFPSSPDDLTNLADDINGQVNVLFDEISRGAGPPVTDCDYQNVVAILHDMSNFHTLADRVQQGMLDFLYVGRALVHPDGLGTDPEFKVAPGGAGAIDRTQLYYDGNSQGGIIGGALAAVFVDGDRATLGVPGMNYSTLLQRSSDWGTGQPPEPEADLPEYSWFMYSFYPNELQRQLLLSMIQMEWDRAEANGYALHMTDDPLPNTPAHHVILNVGLGDHQVAQVSAEVEARTIGARAHFPWAPAGRDLDRGNPIFGVPAIDVYPFDGSAIVLWDIGPPRLINGKTCSGGKPCGTKPPPNTNTPPDRNDLDPHEYPRRQPNGRTLKSIFLSPGGKVIDPCGGGPCLADPTL